MVGSNGKGCGVDALAPKDAVTLGSTGSSSIKAAFVRHGARTALERIYEAGALRLRHPRGPACEAILVNTAGGVVGGDRLSADLCLAPGAVLTVTSAAAEKIYGAESATTTIDTHLQLGAEACLDWLPQETILFDKARLARRFAVDMERDARLLAAEILIFGRLAKGETAIHGALRDSWRVRRDGRLVFADEAQIEGAIGAALDRPAIGGGARAAALVLLIAPDAEDHLAPLRAALDPLQATGTIEAGASASDGVLVARLLSRVPEHVRDAVASGVAAVRGVPAPRSWS